MFTNVPTDTVVHTNPNAARSGNGFHGPHKRFGSDKIGIVGFHGTAFPIALPTEPHAAWLHQRVQALPSKVSGSGTNITDALRKSLDMALKAPPGAQRRIWLLSDGEAIIETEGIFVMADRVRDAHININVVGFGDSYDERTLRAIADRTHAGKFIPVNSLRALSAALVANSSGGHGIKRHHHRAEYTILAIDCSPSMNDAMEGRKKIEVVREAIFHLLHWKQQNFA
jgi:Mg-chelatase subunit ChlD